MMAIKKVIDDRAYCQECKRKLSKKEYAITIDINMGLLKKHFIHLYLCIPCLLKDLAKFIKYERRKGGN